MADIMGMDELETFVLDFLAYRREQRMKTKPSQEGPPKLIEQAPEITPENHHSIHDAGYIPPTIGRGWPHYRGTNSNQRRASRSTLATSQAPAQSPPTTTHNDIIPALAPVVAKALTRFGPPTSQKALDHLINQVIASAIEMPPVNESIQTAEIKPWGRVALLQAVVELLIRISLN